MVADLAKWAFWRPHVPADDIILSLARRDFGHAGAEAAVEAWRHWSEAILDYVPTNEDQYGPFRVGPAYPLLLSNDEIEFPAADYAHFGNRILNTAYQPHDAGIVDGEIACLEAMSTRWAQGVEAMERAVEATPPRKREDAERMLALAAFIGCCVRTTINVKRWWQLRQRLDAAADTAESAAVLESMAALGQAEIDNVDAAMPLVASDSRLGWEPSMEYMADPAHLEWKIAQVRHVLEEEIPSYRG